MSQLPFAATTSVVTIGIDLMSLSAGSRLGPYEILAPIGAGAMGEVYRARDTKLGRDVALKVLPDSVGGDPERLARFEREAKLLAALNHPNIAHIHGFEDSTGVPALVMELVEGPTLADRIAQGRVPIDEALPIARQVAEALEAAHEQGIIHRDLKPANIKVREDGTVKVLDFGLAKALEPGGTGASGKSVGFHLTASPTVTSPVLVTTVGTVLGTAAYMSPEQAKGRPADKRSDLWSFGCVLFEMLAGRRPFDGEDVPDVIAAIVRGEPEWALLPHETPQPIRLLLRRCLEKDRTRRVADGSTVRFLLTEPELGVGSQIVAETTRKVPPWWSKRMGPLAAAAFLGSALTGMAAWRLWPSMPESIVTRFTYALPAGQRFTNTGRQVIALSPDGTHMVYVANQRLYVKSMQDTEAKLLSADQSGAGVTSPVFSSDGRWVAYWSQSTLNKIAVTGGAPIRLCQIENPYGMSWNGDTLFVGGGPNGIYRVPANGGSPEAVIRVGNDEIAHGPQLLPDGRSVLFTLATGKDPERWDNAQIVVQAIGSTERKTIIKGAADARYYSSGHLVYASGSVLFGQSFDLRKLETRGGPILLVEGVRRAAGTGSAQFAVSDAGSLMYVPGPLISGSERSELALLDRNGTVERLKLPGHRYHAPRFSPDGQQLAVGIDDGKNANIWVYDLGGTHQMRQLTLEGKNRFPIWTSDGSRIAFQSDREGDQSVFWQRADGNGPAERLTKAEQGQRHIPNAWSPDGNTLLFTAAAGQRQFSLRVFTLRDKKDIPLDAVLSSTDPGGGFSRDGRWVTYQAGESENTRDSSVFVRPFPATEVKYRIGDGVSPFWAPDGKDLYFVSNPGASAFSVVKVTTTPEFSLSEPVLFPRPEVTGGGPNLPRAYDVAPDNQHFVILVRPERVGESESDQIEFVLNWFEELKARVPPK